MAKNLDKPGLMWCHLCIIAFEDFYEFKAHIMDHRAQFEREEREEAARKNAASPELESDDENSSATETESDGENSIVSQTESDDENATSDVSEGRSCASEVRNIAAANKSDDFNASPVSLQYDSYSSNTPKNSSDDSATAMKSSLKCDDSNYNEGVQSSSCYETIAPNKSSKKIYGDDGKTSALARRRQQCNKKENATPQKLESSFLRRSVRKRKTKVVFSFEESPMHRLSVSANQDIAEHSENKVHSECGGENAASNVSEGYDCDSDCNLPVVNKSDNRNILPALFQCDSDSNITTRNSLDVGTAAAVMKSPLKCDETSISDTLTRKHQRRPSNESPKRLESSSLRRSVRKRKKKVAFSFEKSPKQRLSASQDQNDFAKHSGNKSDDCSAATINTSPGKCCDSNYSATSKNANNNPVALDKLPKKISGNVKKRPLLNFLTRKDKQCNKKKSNSSKKLKSSFLKKSGQKRKKKVAFRICDSPKHTLSASTNQEDIPELSDNNESDHSESLFNKNSNHVNPEHVLSNDFVNPINKPVQVIPSADGQDLNAYAAGNKAIQPPLFVLNKVSTKSTLSKPVDRFTFSSKNILKWLTEHKKLCEKIPYPFPETVFNLTTTVHKAIFDRYCNASIREESSAVLKVYEELGSMIHKHIDAVHSALKAL